MGYGEVMAIPVSSLEDCFDAVMNRIFSRIPQPEPSRDIRASCRLISHRGVFDNRDILENTVPAFQKAAASGAWGIELDLQWTKDRQPVVSHDPDLRRLFHRPELLSEFTLGELKSRVPVIPSVTEIVEIFGGNCHLMLEIKSGSMPAVDYAKGCLKEIFKTLAPCRDYHFLCFDPQMYGLVNFAPPSVFLPIARTNVLSLSRMALKEGFGGLCGHYALVPRALIRRHRKAGQHVGTGFPHSTGCLFREMRRGVKWIFTNNPDMLQSAGV
jgi:glycerophosphoryl diester phosphodiesterase